MVYGEVMASGRKWVGGHIPEDGDARERSLWRSRKLIKMVHVRGHDALWE